jgi:hypothetical protein
VIDRLGGRKVVVALAVLLLCIGVVAVKGDVPPGLVSMLQFLFGSFVVGNVGEHAAAAYAAAKAPDEAAPAAPAADYSGDFVHLNQQLGTVKTQLDGVERVSTAILDATNTSQKGVAYIVSRLPPSS